MKRVAWLDTVRVFSSLLVIISHYVICFEQFDFPIMREFWLLAGALLAAENILKKNWRLKIFRRHDIICAVKQTKIAAGLGNDSFLVNSFKALDDYWAGCDGLFFSVEVVDEREDKISDQAN